MSPSLSIAANLSPIIRQKLAIEVLAKLLQPIVILCQGIIFAFLKD